MIGVKRYWTGTVRTVLDITNHGVGQHGAHSIYGAVSQQDVRQSLTRYLGPRLRNRACESEEVNMVCKCWGSERIVLANATT